MSFISFKKRKLNHFMKSYELNPARVATSNSLIQRYCSLRYPKSFNLIHFDPCAQEIIPALELVHKNVIYNLHQPVSLQKFVDNSLVCRALLM